MSLDVGEESLSQDQRPALLKGVQDGCRKEGSIHLELWGRFENVTEYLFCANPIIEEACARTCQNEGFQSSVCRDGLVISSLKSQCVNIPVCKLRVKLNKPQGRFLERQAIEYTHFDRSGWGIIGGG